MGSPGSRDSKQQTHRNKFEKIALLRKRGFSIFVDNLPMEMDRVWLFQLFRSDGEIFDVFVSNRYRKAIKHKFGFVRFTSRESANRAMVNKNGLIVRGRELKIKPATNNKRARRDDTITTVKRTKWVWKPTNKTKNVQADRTKGEFHTAKGREDTKRTIKLNTVEEKLQWLKRSVIGFNSYPRELEGIESQLRKEWPQIEAVRSLGHYKTLITFEDEEVKEWALSTYKELLLQFFEEVEPWSRYERAESKRVWVEIRGMPPQAWSLENFETIVDKWGRLVCMDRETHLGKKLEIARVLVDTNFTTIINESLYVQVGDIGSDLNLMEVKVIQADMHLVIPNQEKVNQPAPISDCSSSMTPEKVEETMKEEGEVQSRRLEAEEVDMNKLENQHGEFVNPNTNLKGQRVNSASPKTSEKGKGNDLESERTRVVISDNRRTEDVVKAFNEVANYIPNSPVCSIGNQEEADDNDFSPPGFGRWVGPINVEITNANSIHIPEQDETLSSDNENSRDTLEFEFAKKVGEGGGVRAIDLELAKKFLGKARKEKKEMNKKRNIKKESKKESKKSNKLRKIKNKRNQ